VLTCVYAHVPTISDTADVRILLYLHWGQRSGPRSCRGAPVFEKGLQRREARRLTVEGKGLIFDAAEGLLGVRVFLHRWTGRRSRRWACCCGHALLRRVLVKRHSERAAPRRSVAAGVIAAVSGRASPAGRCVCRTSFRGVASGAGVLAGS